MRDLRKAEDLLLGDRGRDLHSVYVVYWCFARLVDCMVDFRVVAGKRRPMLKVGGNSEFVVFVVFVVVDVAGPEVAVQGRKMYEDSHQ